MLNGPRRTKYKKTKKGKLSNLEFKSNELRHGTVGLKASESGILTYKQIEATRQVIARKTKRKTKIWIRVFTDLPVTSKPTGVRMGKGKGQVSHWGARIRGGSVIFEVCGANIITIKAALKSAKSKLPIRTQIFF